MCAKKIYLYFLFTIVIIITSCSSVPLKVDKTEERYYLNKNNGHVYNTDNLEFIGFSCDSLSRNKNPDEDLLGDYDFWKRLEKTSGLSKLARTISDMGYAEDGTLSNFNDYSLYELDKYNTDARFLSFVEVKNNYYSVDDNHISKNVKATIGTVANIAAIIEFLAALSVKDEYYRGYKIVDNSGLRALYYGYGLGYLGIGTLFTLINLNPVKSKFTYNGEYIIYVYDRVDRKMILKRPVNVKLDDSFIGIIEAKGADEDLLYEYYGQIIANKLMRVYENLENDEDELLEPEVENLCKNDKWVFEGSGKNETADINSEFVLIGVGGKYENWESILYQNVKLERGCKYRFSFEAKSDIKRIIMLNVNSNTPNYYRYLQDQTITLNEDYTLYSFDFKSTSDIEKAKAELLLGKGNKSNVSIRNIVIQKIN